MHSPEWASRNYPNWGISMEAWVQNRLDEYAPSAQRLTSAPQNQIRGAPL